MLNPLNLFNNTIKYHNNKKHKKLKPFYVFLSNPKINQRALKMQEVIRENLVPGKEYYLERFNYLQQKKIAKFEKLITFNEDSKWWACFTNLREIKYKNNPTSGYYMSVGYDWKFYEIASRDVQKNMENRAYNRVLLDLIKDEYFRPIEVI